MINRNLFLLTIINILGVILIYSGVQAFDRQALNKQENMIEGATKVKLILEFIELTKDYEEYDLDSNYVSKRIESISNNILDNEELVKFFRKANEIVLLEGAGSLRNFMQTEFKEMIDKYLKEEKE